MTGLCGKEIKKPLTSPAMLNDAFKMRNESESFWQMINKNTINEMV